MDQLYAVVGFFGAVVASLLGTFSVQYEMNAVGDAWE